MTAIDGTTQLFATIGNPVAQIRMPLIMPAVFKAIGANAVWLPLEVAPDGLATCLDMLRLIRNFAGFSITVPYKTDFRPLIDNVSARAAASGSINLVRREADGSFFGDIVDGVGFVDGLQAEGHQLAGKSVCLVGCGGAGSAIAAALCEAGIASLILIDLDRDRATTTRKRLLEHYPLVQVRVGRDLPAEADFAINATPLGMQPDDPLPFDPAAFPASTIICDIIMRPAKTALLLTAERNGQRIQPGAPMLDWQIPRYLDFFGLAHNPHAVMKAVQSAG